MPARSPIRAVFFDVDGVLLDSLPAHLQICEDLSREYGLDLKIPSILEFQRMSKAGLPLSPMKAFFMTLGFGEANAMRATSFYENHFHEKYSVPLFPSIGSVLDELRDTGVALGIVTANVQVNVEKALGNHWSCFDSRLRYTWDHPTERTKAAALGAGARALNLRPDEILFVGDQYSDHAAARQADVPFLGVTYGWGISREDKGFDTVDQPTQLVDYILQTKR